MTGQERNLIQYVAENNLQRARDCAKYICENNKVAKDRAFCDYMLTKMQMNALTRLPANVEGLLIAENVTEFDTSRILFREKEKIVADDIISTHKLSDRLKENGIAYYPSLLLYGQSGCGKTTLAKYIAHEVGLPYLYVRFSSVVSSYLGSTQGNVSKIFDFARTTPCVLCLDELDAIGTARGDSKDVTEMSRAVIALMQEMDRFPTGSILIGTTNRPDKLDKALIRRFSSRYEVEPFSNSEIKVVCNMFFANVGIEIGDWFADWFRNNFVDTAPASTVVEKCTQKTIQIWKKEAQ